MAKEYSVVTNLKANISNFKNGIQNAKSATEEFTKNFKSNVRESQDSIDRLSDKMSSFKDKMKTFGVVTATAFGVAAGALGKMGFDFNASMEQSQIAWSTLLGNGKQATKMIKDLLQLGAKTPFEFEGLDQSAKLLKAMGFNAQQIVPTLTTLGNAVSAVGGGQDQLEGIARAIGQIQTKGKVSAEEINQLAELGIPAWQLMAKNMGMSAQELMKMSSQGKIMAKDAIPALIKGLNENFGGAMDKQSKTWNGMISTIKDNLKMLAGSLTKPLFNMAESVLPKIISKINQLQASGKLDEWAKKITDGFTKAWSVIKSFGETAISIGKGIYDHWNIIAPILAGVVASFMALKGIMALVEVYRAITIAQIALNVAMDANPIGIIILAIGALVATGVALWMNWNKIKAKAIEIWNGIKNYFIKTFNFLDSITNGAFTKIKDTVLLYLNMVWGIVKAVFGYIIGTFKNVLHFLSALVHGDFKGMKDAIHDQMKLAWNTIVSIWNNVMDFFKGINLLDIGKNIIMGLINGIKSMASSVINSVKNVVGDAIEGAKRLLGINSPSKVFMEIGEYSGEGLVIGLGNKIKDVAEQARKMANALMPNYSLNLATSNLYRSFGTNLRTSSLSGSDSSNVETQPVMAQPDVHYHFQNVNIKANNMTEFLNDINFYTSQRRS